MKWWPFLAVGALTLSLAHADAQTIVLNNTHSNSSGVKIVAGGWSATDGHGQPLHADATYNAFNKVRNGKLGQYDFYYSLEVVPQFSNAYDNCATGPNLLNFLKSLFGTTTGALIVVKADVQYRWTTGIEVDFLKNDAGLVVAGLGPSSTQAQAGFGCYFDTTLRPTFPLLQYGGGGVGDNFDDFVMKFIVEGGSATSLNLVSNVVSLFGDVSAAAGWSAITGGLGGVASQNIQKAAQSFQTALQQASTLQNQVSVGYTLKANGGPDDGKLAISIPDLFGADQANGDLVIYVRRTGSIALANSGQTITLTTVFDNPALANRQCNPTNIASGNCNTNATAPIRVALATILKGVDTGLGDGTNPTTKLIDVADAKREANTYNMCKGIRTAARQYLHLSTLDETLIRWAFTKEGGLQDALKDAATDPTKAAALATATGAKSLADLADMCWNNGDEQTLEEVAKNLNKTISN